MRLFILITMGLLYTNITYAQITTEPNLPTANSPVTIYFDATNTPLEGHTGPIYTHTGVHIQGVGNWQNVIGDWGDNDVQPQLESLGDDLYKLEIEPSIKEFYSVGDTQVITHMAFVFRAASGSPQTIDYFVEVVEEGVVVVITSPTGLQPIFEVNDVITISAAANFSNNLELYVNEEFITSTTEETLSYDWTAEETGTFYVKFIAEGDDDTAEAETYFYVRPEVPVAELPEGVLPGINYIDESTVTLVLHDPPALINYAFVIGDFNDWGVGEENYMNRTPDGTHYWITIEDLTPDTEYAFQYYIDSELRLADPYTHKILDPWNDQWISSFNYPNLMPYPEETTGLVSIMHPGKSEYEWQTTDFTPPAVEDMVIYELLIRDFVETSAIKTVMDSLDYLQNMGVNVIELMPINQFGGNISWGYNPMTYFATDKAYGTMEDYKSFIDAAHARGMAVVIDIVLNHSDDPSPLVQMYWDSNLNRPLPENPWYLETCPHEPWCWFQTFDQDSEYAHEYFKRIVQYWLEEFRVDGFRFDFTKGFTNQQTGGQGWNYDAARIANLKRIADQAWEVNPDAYIILEHFTANDEEKELAEYGMLLWGNITHSYQEAAMGWIPQSDFSWISYKNRGWSVPHLVGYMESHDEERIMHKNLRYGNSENPAHDVKNLTTALQRAELVAAFYFTVPGPKMIWQFGELGYDYSINHCGDDPNVDPIPGDIDDGCRVDPKPVRWDYFDDWRRRRLYYVYSALANLKTSQEIFRTSDYQLSVSGETKRIQLNLDGEHVNVIGNFGVEEHVINPNFQRDGMWYEFFTGKEVEITNIHEGITLKPGEYRLYSTINFPDHGYPLNVGDEINSINENIYVYPNPSQNIFNFSYYSEANNEIIFEVFDIQGKKVFSDKINTSRGENVWVWDAAKHKSSNSKGFYFYKIIAGENVYSGKLILN